MTLDEVEIGRKYRCDFNGAQYFATALGKDAENVLVRLGDIVNKDGDAGNPTERFGTIGEIYTSPDTLHPM